MGQRTLYLPMASP